MRCANCGAEIKVGSVFCSECGKEAQIVPDYNVLEEDYLKVLLDEKQQTRPASQNDQATKKRGAKKKKSSRWYIWVVVVCLVLLLGVVVTFFAIQKFHENSFVYQYEQGISLVKERNYTKALTYFEAAAALEPHDVEVLLQIAQIHLQRQEYSAAEQTLRKALAEDQQNKQTLQLLIELYEEQKKYDEIRSLSEKITDASLKQLFGAYTVAAPVFSPESGKYAEELKIEIDAAAQDTIYYTMDGSDPIKNGVPYTGEISLEDEGSYVIRATACDDRGFYSPVESGEYEIEFIVPDMAVTNPSPGTYHDSVEITIYVPDGMRAYYTWDDADPTMDSQLYTEPLSLPEGNHILAIVVVDSHGLSSPVARYNYIYQPE